MQNKDEQVSAKTEPSGENRAENEIAPENPAEKADAILQDYYDNPEGEGSANICNSGTGNKNRKSFLKGILAGSAGTIVALALICGIFYFVVLKNTTIVLSSGAEDSASEKLVKTKAEYLIKLIHQYYLEDVDDNTLADGVYSGLLDSLGDPYSVYYNEEEYKEITESTSGTYAGIGAYISQNTETGVVTISRPFEGSPAEKAGLITGDVLTAVNGEKIAEDDDLSMIVSKIKGEPGTDVVLTIVRDDETMDVTVTRDNIEVTTVSGRMLDDEIGEITILEFDDVTTAQFENVLEDLQSQGMKKLIVDLRDNPGGSLSVVVDILDDILPEGLLVYTEDKYGNREEYNSDAQKSLEIPMAILVNENSASASEIFAGAIKDYKWGTLIGTTTFGKGIVQNLIPIGDGTAVKITVSKYYTPSGKNIHGIGIDPDIEAELPEDVYEDGILEDSEDTQLQKAIEVLQEK